MRAKPRRRALSSHVNFRTIFRLQTISVNPNGLVSVFLHEDTQYLKTTADTCLFINIFF